MSDKALIVTEVRVKGESEHHVLPRPEIKRLLDEGQVEAVFKYGLMERGAPEGKPKKTHKITGKFLRDGRPVANAVITTANPDRDGDVVNAGGVELKNYLKNPVVLPMHHHTFPVGFTQQLRQYDDRLWAEWQWLSDQPDTEGPVYQRLWDSYVLNATSIGFLPSEVQDGERGWNFDAWELLEFSPVVIPANAEALRTDGVKQELEHYGELVHASGSPIVKSLWTAGAAKDRPKQVSVPSVVCDDGSPGPFTITVKGPGGYDSTIGPITIDPDLPDTTTKTETPEVGPADETGAASHTGQEGIVEELTRARGDDGAVIPLKVMRAGLISLTDEGEGGGQEAREIPEELGEARLAFAVGAIDGEAFLDEVAKYVRRICDERDAALLEAEGWKAKVAELAARVVVRG